jgi:uncharacterized protein YlxW (UPF0749 family)
MMLGIHYHTTSAENVVSLDREQELALEKKVLVEDLYGLQKEISELSVKLEKLGLGEKEAAEALARELAKIKRFAGLSAVSGPGVEVVVQGQPGDDGSGTVQASKVLDEHLMKMLNELFSAGSEAVAINGQRITAVSEVRLAGNHINVNGTPLEPPYQILAIGNASDLKNRLELRGGLVEYLLSEYGISVETREKDKVVIPAFKGELYFEYAEPVKEI